MRSPTMREQSILTTVLVVLSPIFFLLVCTMLFN